MLGGELIQSLISLAEPNHVFLPYTQSMLLPLVSKQKPARILNLGSGCGTFERFFFKFYPDSSITSVEENIDIINVSRKYFYIPSDHAVLNESADVFLKNNDIKHDVIFCDVHDGKNHPGYLCDVDFYAKAKHCLNHDGVLVINLIPDCDDDLLSVLVAVRKVFRWQYLLNFDNCRNIILYIYAQEPRSPHANDAIGGVLKERANIDLTNTIERLILLPTAQII